jgi:DNA-binding transcriptional regulator LsrR (DeoR family)
MNNYSDQAFRVPCDASGSRGPLPLGPGDEAVPAGAKHTPCGARHHEAHARLIARVARLYHEGCLTQNQIATRLRFSQGNVCRLLQKAEAHGIVRVTVIPPEGTFVDLEELLERRFGLAQVIIAKASWDADQPVQSALGAAAAHFLETTLRPRDVVGVPSGSASLLAMVEQMHPIWKVADCQVVQILGGLGDPSTEAHAHYLVERLASFVLGKARFLPAPGVVESKEAADVLAQDLHLRETMALFDRITVALVGIGSVEPTSPPVGLGGFFSAEALQTLQSKGAVGHVCLRFYDSRGEEMEYPRGVRVFGLESARLKTIPRVVGIAGGKRKRQAILGALQGGWVNVLITDQFTAEALARA